jgi:hypothetical protein
MRAVLYYYHVYAGNKHIDLVHAYNEADACERILKRWGPASRYSYQSQGSYRAVKA